MTYFQAVFLAVVQGLAEFLPVSSSGHLVIFQKLFGLKPPVIFDVLVHVGTLGSVVFFFRNRLAQIMNGLVRKDKDSWRVVALVAVGTMPAIIFGLVLQSRQEQIFDSYRLVGFSLLVTSILLFSTKLVKTNITKDKKETPGWQSALIIGLLQALAILPGVSRSGSTIVAGLWRGMSRKIAFQFSFFLAIPAILGALILQIPDLINSQSNLLNQSILGMLIAAVTGYAALKILEKLLVKAKLWVFGVYCLFLALVLLNIFPKFL